MSSPRLRPVTILSAGGTIAMASAAGAVSPELDGEALVAAVPGLAEVRDLRVRSLLNRASAQLTGAEALLIASTAAAEAHSGRGVVVTHGTDTLEEVAFLADLVHPGDAPIVFTGAMRAASAPGADGPANLIDAVTVAGAPWAAGVGAVVVFAGNVHAARSVRKADSTALDAFESSRAGVLGRVEEGRVRLERILDRRPAIETQHFDAFVPVIPAGVGMDGRLVDAALEVGAEGIVVVALGAGHVAPPMLAALRRAVERVPVVAAVRPGRGAILYDTYSFEGSERDVRESGIVAAASLTPAAARVKLMACLGAELDRDAITAAFAPDDQ